MIAEARFEDINDVIKIHIKTFPNFFSTSCGKDFLEIYYKNYLSNSKHIFLVAKANDKAVGFASGTSNPKLLRMNLVKNNLLPLIKLILYRFIKNREFRKQFLNKMHVLISSRKLSIFRLRSNNPKRIDNAILKGHLYLIAVCEEFRGN